LNQPGNAARPAESNEGLAAVVDIGSNSIRLVVFDGLKRAFLPLFNEKVICGLGRGLQSSGHLSEEGVVSALINLKRFAAIARAMEVAELRMVATAAVREAENGPEFVAEVERCCKAPVEILSGEEEARLAAFGVLAGIPDADGVVGDLGGGSLELVALYDERLGASKTLALGPLRLMDIARGRQKRAIEVIDGELERLEWLDEIEGRDFYAVGGAWRNLARLHMEQVEYPLQVLHGYAMPCAEAEQLARLVAGLGKRSLARIPAISRRRAETLPYAALLLGRLLRRCRPARLVLSAYGLREGLMLDRLPADKRDSDPLIAAAAELARANGRFSDLGDALTRWTDPIFPDEAPAARRLRSVACHLSDLAWREHPGYRADHAMNRVLHYPFMALDHSGRAFLAAAVSTRYRGDALSSAAEPILALLPPGELRRARVTGLALRLAYTLSAGVKSLLDKVALETKEGRLCLALPRDGSIPSGEIVEQHLQALIEASKVKSGGILA